MGAGRFVKEAKSTNGMSGPGNRFKRSKSLSRFNRCSCHPQQWGLKKGLRRGRRRGDKEIIEEEMNAIDCSFCGGTGLVCAGEVTGYQTEYCPRCSGESKEEGMTALTDDDRPRIPVEECKHRKLYRFHARNFDLGVYHEGRKGFMGLREKFGSEYPFMEYHWDNGPPFGTVSPIEELDDFLPEDIKLTESEPTFCKNCGVRAKWRKTDPDSYKGVWYHLAETDCDNVSPACHSNRVLQRWLEQMIVKHKSEFTYIFTGELDKHHYIGTDEEDE